LDLGKTAGGAQESKWNDSMYVHSSLAYGKDKFAFEHGEEADNKRLDRAGDMREFPGGRELEAVDESQHTMHRAVWFVVDADGGGNSAGTAKPMEKKAFGTTPDGKNRIFTY